MLTEYVSEETCFCRQSVYFNVSLKKTIHPDIRTFPDVALHIRNKFHRYYNSGP